MSFETETDPISECQWLYKKSTSRWKTSFKLVCFCDTILLKETLKKLFYPFQCRKEKNPVFYSGHVQPQVSCSNRRNFFWEEINCVLGTHTHSLRTCHFFLKTRLGRTSCYDKN